MKIRTHYHIARIAVESLPIESQPGNILRFLFCFGAMLPDLGVGQLIHPHFYEISHRYILRQIQKLQTVSCLKYTPLRLLALGRIAHYLSDFCCRAHRTGHIGNIPAHLQYERLQHRYFLKNIAGFQNAFHFPPDSEVQIQTILQEYRCCAEDTVHPFRLDLTKSIEICRALLKITGPQSISVNAPSVLPLSGSIGKASSSRTGISSS